VIVLFLWPYCPEKNLGYFCSQLVTAPVALIATATSGCAFVTLTATATSCCAFVALIATATSGCAFVHCLKGRHFFMGGKVVAEGAQNWLGK